MQKIDTLQALLDDVKGNEFLNNSKKQSGYLKSISLLADAMARRSWQQFELDVLDELREMSNAEIKNGLDTKAKLALREFELSDLNVKLADFLAQADSNCFVSKEAAAESLRAIADSLEKSESALFPKPPTKEDLKAYCESIGASYSAVGNVDDLMESLGIGTNRKTVPTTKKAPAKKATRGR